MRNAQPGPWDEVTAVELGTEALPPGVMSEVDTVFHLAAKVHALDEAGDDATVYRRVNVVATESLVAAAIEAEVPRFVFFSSVKAMGEGGEVCLDETCAAPPETAYGASKLAAEQRVLDAGRSASLHATVLRLPLVYGAGVKGNLASMLDAIARGRFPPLAGIDNKRSMVHVDDVVEAALLAARSPAAAGETYIVTDGRAYSTSEIYRLMRHALGRGDPAWSMPHWLLGMMAKAGDVIGRARGRRFLIDSDKLSKLTGSAWYNSAKIERALRFQPRHDLQSALPAMVEEYRRQRTSVQTGGED